MVAGNRYYTAYTRCSCEIKKRRRELGNLIKRFRSGAESLPDAVVLTTEEGGIFWCNGLAQQILGLRWPEDNGQNILNLLRYPEFTQYLKTRDFFSPAQSGAQHRAASGNSRHALYPQTVADGGA